MSHDQARRAASHRIAAASMRLAALRERTRQLHAGQPATIDDLVRARLWAATEAAQAIRAEERLLAARSHASRWQPPPLPDRPGQAADERLPELLSSVVALTGSSCGSPGDDDRRRLWAGLVDECGQPGWRGWAYATCRAACRQLPVDGTAVGLHHASGYESVVTSDDWTAGLEDLHQVVGEGPAQMAVETGRPVIVADLADHRDRWPGYVAVMAPAGLRSVWALPLWLADAPVGVVTFLGRTTHVPTARQRRLADAVAELATPALIGDADALERPDLPDRPELLERASVSETTDVVETRAVGLVRSPLVMLHIATGVVSIRLGITTDEARLRLRGYAFGAELSLPEVARRVVEGWVPPI